MSIISKLTCLTACLFLAISSTAAQEKMGEELQEQTEKSVQPSSQDQFPFKGEIKAEKLNVRVAPGTDGKIVSVLHMGENVIVLGQTKSFYQIYINKGSTGWVYKNNLKVVDGKGVVQEKNTPIRIDSRANADQVGTLQEGDTVKVIKEHAGWYKIEAESTVKLYAAAKYIRNIGPVDPNEIPEALRPRSGVTKETFTPADKEARDLMKKAEMMAEALNEYVKNRELTKIDFAAIAEVYEQAAGLAKSASVKKEAEDHARAYRRANSTWALTKAQIDILKGQIEVFQEIQEKAAREKMNKVTYTYTGYIDSTGAFLPNRPGTHKLTTGDGRWVCFLRARNDDEALTNKMSSLFKQYVGVRGTVIRDPVGWKGHCVVLVDEIEVVKESEATTTLSSLPASVK